MSEYYSNAKRRTDLNAGVTKTMTFKVCYPTYATFQDALTSKGITVPADLVYIYSFLQEMMGNNYLYFTTADKNKGFLAYNWKKYYPAFERQQKIFDKTLDEALTSEVSGENKLFRVNRTAQGTLELKYLDSGTTTDAKSKVALIDRLDQLEQWANRADPQVKFLANIAQSIQLPYQPEAHGGTY